MTFLVSFAATLCEWLLSKLGVEVWDWIKEFRAQEAIKAVSLADATALTNAHTVPEQTSALDQTIDHTFTNKP